MIPYGFEPDKIEYASLFIESIYSTIRKHIGGRKRPCFLDAALPHPRLNNFLITAVGGPHSARVFLRRGGLREPRGGRAAGAALRPRNRAAGGPSRAA